MSTKPITNPTTYVTLSGNQSAGLFDGSFAPVYSAINDVQTYQNYIADTGAADAYVLVLPAGWVNGSGLAAGLQVQWLAANTNTGAATLDFNGSGATPIKRIDGSVLTAGDIPAGGIIVTQYDGVRWQLLSPVASLLPTNGAQVWLATKTASGSATLDFTSLISATYDIYDFVISGLTPSVDGVNLWLRVSEDNGATWKSGSSDYLSQVLTFESGVAVYQNLSSVIFLNGTGLPLGSSALLDDANGTVRLYHPLGTSAFKAFTGSLNYIPQLAGHITGAIMNGRYVATRNAINALRFLPSLGLLSAGTITMYGTLPS